MLTKKDFPEALNEQFRPALTSARCPKCKSSTLTITETMEAFTEFEVIDGRLNREAGIHNFGGWIGKLFGKCLKCHHTWNFRNNAGQIDEIITELDPKTLKPIDQDN